MQHANYVKSVYKNISPDISLLYLACNTNRVTLCVIL